MTSTVAQVLQITNIVRVDIPVRDRDEAIAFYTETLGFSLVVDNPFGDGKRWVEVAPPHGGVTVALTWLLVIVIGAPPAPRYETVAELRIVVPTGVGVATCASAAPCATRSRRTADALAANRRPIDAPKAGRLFTVPPASCVGTCRDRLCIGSHLAIRSARVS